MRARTVVALIGSLTLWLAVAPAAQAETVIKFYYPVGVAGPLAKVINGMVEQFNQANPEIRVEPVYAGNYNQTMQKAQTAVLGGNPPDVAVIEISEILSLRAMDATIPLDDYIAQEGGQAFIDQYYPAFFGNARVEGEIYAFPFQRSTPVLYWNKDLFRASAAELKAAGLDPGRPPKDWQELKAYAQVLTRVEDGQVKQYGVILPGGWNDWIFEAFSRQNGSQLMSDDGRTVTFDNPANREALEFWVELTQKVKASPPLRPWNITPEDFIAGTTAMMYYSTGGMAKVRREAKFDFGVAFQPAGKQYGTPVGGGDFHIFKNIATANQDAAWKFIKFMTTPEMAAHWSRESGYIAINKRSYDLPEMKAFIDKYPQMAVARDQLEYSYPKMMAINYQKIRNAMTINLDAAMLGKKSPADALRDAHAEMEKAIAGR